MKIAKGIINNPSQSDSAAHKADHLLRTYQRTQQCTGNNLRQFSPLCYGSGGLQRWHTSPGPCFFQAFLTGWPSQGLLQRGFGGSTTRSMAALHPKARQGSRTHTSPPGLGSYNFFWARKPDPGGPQDRGNRFQTQV